MNERLRNVHQDRENLVLEMIKDQFPIKNMLYVGAFRGACALVDMFKTNNPSIKITLIEAFEDSVNYFKQHKLFDRVVHANVVDCLSHFEPAEFDAVVWWHGPEHVEKLQSICAIKDLETLASKIILIGSPWGNRPQKNNTNTFQNHVSAFDIYDFNKLGYQDIKTIGGIHRPSNCLIAIKRLGI